MNTGYSRQVGVAQTIAGVRTKVQAAHVFALVAGRPHLVCDVETVHVHQVVVHAYVIALQPVQPEPDDQVRQGAEHRLPVRYVRLVEHLAHRHVPELLGVLRVLGDRQPVGDEQLREVHLDDGVAAGAADHRVRLDHPLALDGHPERARELRRGDHALALGQRLVERRPAPGHAAAAAANDHIIVVVVVVVFDDAGCRGQHGDGRVQHGRAGLPTERSHRAVVRGRATDPDVIITAAAAAAAVLLSVRR